MVIICRWKHLQFVCKICHYLYMFGQSFHCICSVLHFPTFETVNHFTKERFNLIHNFKKLRFSHNEWQLSPLSRAKKVQLLLKGIHFFLFFFLPCVSGILDSDWSTAEYWPALHSRVPYHSADSRLFLSFIQLAPSCVSVY